MKNYRLLIFPILIVCVLGCQKVLDSPGSGDYKRPELPAEAYHYALADAELPSHIREALPFDNGGVTNEGATLGRVLFYDKALSINNRTSCGSCHHQSLGFADGKAKSNGFSDKETKRNSPTCANMIMSSRFFWDGRAQTLEEQVMMPVADHIEMGLDDVSYLIGKIERLDYYEELFFDAFGSSEVNKDRIASALSQFLNSMVSYRSKFDIGVQIDFANFSQLEREGYELFSDWERMHCSSCHGGTSFAGWGGTFANIGLEMNYSDQGVGLINGIAESEGVFKVPTLRNVALTAPYMHDGRFQTLEEVIEHYNSGVVAHPNLNWNLIDQSSLVFNDFGQVVGNSGLQPRKLNLTEREKQSLVAFMKTLTDNELTVDPRFSDPFN